MANRNLQGLLRSRECPSKLTQVGFFEIFEASWVQFLQQKLERRLEVVSMLYTWHSFLLLPYWEELKITLPEG